MLQRIPAEAGAGPVEVLSVLREYLPARQVPGDPRRRWFASEKSDLIVWLDGDDAPIGFQFCYDKDFREHALTWMRGRGFNHMAVDSGGDILSAGKGTPLLVADGRVDGPRILELFLAESSLVPEAFVRLVAEKLDELGR
jgi:hypothetical protein